MPRRAQPISELLPGILRQAEQQRSALNTVRMQWRQVAGRALAAHATPVSLRRGRLVVQVDRPGDSFELSFQRPQLLAQLRELTGGRVEELVVRPGELPRRSGPASGRGPQQVVG
jgi:predicted nucleic acid-binding Zn ribbon protein